MVEFKYLRSIVQSNRVWRSAGRVEWMEGKVESNLQQKVGQFRDIVRGEAELCRREILGEICGRWSCQVRGKEEGQRVGLWMWGERICRSFK